MERMKFARVGEAGAMNRLGDAVEDRIARKIEA
jgi:hypothetical protein